MAEIERVAKEFRSALLRRERAASMEMVRAYIDAWLAIKEALDRLTEAMQAAQERGETVGRAWLLREDRLQTLLRQVRNEMDYFARNTSGAINDAQRAVVEMAQQDAQQLVLAGLEEAQAVQVRLTWNRVPSEALSDLVGVLQDGSPFSELLAELGPASEESVKKALIIGLAMGKGPRQIAASIRQALGGNLTRSLTIARTETLRAYRTSSLRAYQENDDVVIGWVWLAALSARTCPACLAMHGTVHPRDEPFGSHPNCRCTPAPLLQGAAPIASGETWLQAQSEAVQNEVLGEKAAQAWREGEVELTDFVRVSHSEKWGTSRSTRSLRDALTFAS